MADTLLVCGCNADHHVDGCNLGQAETVAAEADERAIRDNTHRVAGVFTALVEAGLLLDHTDPRDSIVGFLDALWELGLIKGSGGAS